MTQTQKSKLWAWQRYETDFSFTRKPRNKMGGLSIDSLCMLLNTAKKPISFNELFKQNPIQLKKSFLKYLHFCVDRGLLQDYEEGRLVMYYRTKTGKQLTELLGF